jgi:hypothetical protein
MQEILRSYLKRLTNLTGNNKSLLLLRLVSQHYIDLHGFEFIRKDGSFPIIESLIAGKDIELCPVADAWDEDSTLMSRNLRKLMRSDQFIYEERGSRDLYVGWPFVRGKLSDGTHVRAPLLFFPVEIQLKGDRWMLHSRNNSGTVFNKSFLLAYSHFNKIPLPDEFLDKTFEDFDMESNVFRTSLYQLLKDSPIELHFNQDTFKDQLEPFVEFKKDEFENTYKVGELKLFPEAVLGIFPQAGSYLVPDYIHLLENESLEDLDAFFASRSTTEKEEGGLHEERMLNTLPMDAHQEKALHVIKQGNSVVVQGPPGTGKSQLICNLIADNIASGKRVLVVCQKRAALDIVYERLGKQGLDPFLGLVHDFRSDRKEIYDKIASQIDNIDVYEAKNNGLDAIQLERRFLQVSRSIDQLREELDEFKNALFDDRECGLSVKELYLTSHINGLTVNLKQEYTHFDFNRIAEFASKLRDYSDYAIRFEKQDHPWADRMSFAHYQVSDLKRMKEILTEIPVFKQSVEDRVEKILGHRITLQDCELIMSRRDFIVEMLGVLKKERAYRYFRHMMSYQDQETDHLWLSNTERVMMECYTGRGPEKFIPSAELGHFQEVFQQGLEARSNLLKRLQWKLFSREKHVLDKVFKANEVPFTSAGYDEMAELIDNRLNLEHNLTKLKKKKWLTDIPDNYDKLDFQSWFHIQKLSVKAKLIFTSLRNFKEFMNVQVLTYEELRQKFEDLFNVLTEIPVKKSEWLEYLSPSQLGKIISAPQLIDPLQKSLERDFDSLQEYDALKAGLLNVESDVIHRILDLDGVNTAREVEEVFQNSVRIAWIEHLEMKYPILRSVSSRTFHKKVAELQQLVEEKQKISNDMVLLKVREHMYEHVEYNRLNNRVTYRDLYHQVTKKRRIWPLRKTIAEYYQELFELVPCWLASPESVSAIFPMEALFDLVIFDEASQCFVEQGIPAMYRGRQIVVAGDDKQLRPNDLYQVRLEEDTNDDAALEVESLLELASRHLWDIQLQGHYRSQSLDLIDFSNQHFYKGNLILLPEYHVINQRKPAIEYRKVDGVWDKNVNHVEAQEVVSILLSLIQKSPEKQVGVVTFNARQQQYIHDLLDEHLAKNSLLWPTGWFVKNIENVQGDEKDIIIFSVGYAPDPKGKLALQFGSLNAVHGENRLNVAITRAREQIILVSSILPQELKTEKTKNAGPKLLKKYLEYSWNVSHGKFVPTLPEGEKRHAEWYLKNKLKALHADGLEHVSLEEELPFADLTVKEGENYLGLILTDDDRYYRTPSVKDAHVYLPAVLNTKNWYFTSFFSREYWQDPGRTYEALVHFVNLHKK